MGDELSDACPREIRNYSDIFDEYCSFYLSIGMSYAEYWCGDSDLPRYFRKAFKMRQERENESAWLHGLYVYDAVISALSHVVGGKGSQKEYTAKPYSFSPDAIEQEKEEQVIEAQAQAEVWMNAWASATQKMFGK